MSAERIVLTSDEVNRKLVRIAHEIVEKNSAGPPAIVGIHRRGRYLAERLQPLVAKLTGTEVPLGDLDIVYYRDDISTRAQTDIAPVVHATHLDFSLEGRTVVIVDDVIYTGRTVRAAIDALFDYGRPQRIQLAVLIDRGHRELPIRPDYVGKNLPTARQERVNVQVTELDGVDAVSITRPVQGIGLDPATPSQGFAAARLQGGGERL